MITDCGVCAEKRRACAKSNNSPIEILDRPSQQIAIDHFDPFGYQDREGFRYVLSVRDVFSKLCVLFPVKTKDHLEVTRCLRTYFQINGPVSSVRMDNYFRGDIMDNFSDECNFEKVWSPVYRPEANGIIERVHRDLRELLPQLMKDMKGICDHLGWSKLLSAAAQIINTVPHSTTTFSPYFLHSGYFSNEALSDQTVAELRQRWKIARENMIKRQSEQVKETRSPIPLTMFEKNDQVLVHLPKQKPMLAKIVRDYGTTVLIDKGQEEPDRFRWVCVHKSRISQKTF